MTLVFISHHYLKVLHLELISEINSQHDSDTVTVNATQLDSVVCHYNTNVWYIYIYFHYFLLQFV